MTRRPSFLDIGMTVRIAIAVILYFVGMITIDGFASLATVAAIVENLGLLALVGTGVMITMVVGQLDLAVASVAAVSAIVALSLASVSLALGIVVALAAAMIYGGVVGWLLGRTGVNSLVLTVCTLIGLRGLALVLVPKRPAILPADLLWVSDALVAQIGPVTLLGVISLLLVAVVGVLMRTTRLGLSLYAVGGNLERARGSGVNATFVYIAAFAASAVLAAAAGIFAGLRSGSASGNGLEAFLLAGVTAAVAGGVPLEGGRGTVVNVLIGGLIIRIVATAVGLVGIPNSFESVAVGGILLGMLLFDHRLRARVKRLALNT